MDFGVGVCWAAHQDGRKNKEQRRRDTACRYVPSTHLLERLRPYTANIFILYLFFNISISSGVDTITTTQSLSGNQILVSSGQNFELGFFKPGNSTNYYIGIWYKKVSVQTVVWVANRDRPISDRYSAELKIIDGHLVIRDESKTQIWSTTVNSTASNSTTAVLLDDGNLVLRDVSNLVLPIWQSFDYPTHTFLPGSKLGYNKGTGIERVLTSWKNLEDPAPGLFSLEVNKNGSQFLIRWNRVETYWTSGSWNNFISGMSLNHRYNYSYVSNENESYFTYSLYNSSIISRLIMDVSGEIKQLSWLDRTQEWFMYLNQPGRCNVYRACRAFIACDPDSLPSCSFLSGFEPRSLSDWNKSYSSGGCVRKTNLQCGNNGRASGKKPKFLPSSQLRWPHPSQQVPVWTTGDSESMCFLNCSCSTYAYGYNVDTEIMDCWIWDGEVFNLQESLQINSTGRTTYFKLASSDPRSSYAKVK